MRSGSVFTAVDHCTAECVGIHAVKHATRFKALEPIRQGIHEHFSGFQAGAAEGLQLRHDPGSQFMSDDFQNEIRFLGIESSPAFVREPEGNGCIERFFKTLKEQLLWVRHFQSIPELVAALEDFRALYNQPWLIERLGFLSPKRTGAVARDSPGREAGRRGTVVLQLWRTAAGNLKRS